MNERIVYVLMMAGELQIGSFAPIDECQGIFLSATAARDKADEIVFDAIDGPHDGIHWEPDPALMDDYAQLVLVHDEQAQTETFATVERIELERRSAGDRRGSGR